MTTDNDIIKALECCIDNDRLRTCKELDCPLTKHCKKDVDALEKACLDLIKRQQAEIEGLNIRNKTLAAITKNYDWKFAKAKSEAIKEVLLTLEVEAESSDKYIREYDDSEVQRAYNKALWKSYNLVKEMVANSNE